MVRKSDKFFWGNFDDRVDSFDDSAEFNQLKNYIKNKYKESDGFVLERHPYGKRGPDSVLFKNGIPYIHFAFERRGSNSWHSGKFSFSTLHVPANKNYLIDWAEQDKSKFVSLHFCNDLSRAFYASSEVIKESPIVKIRCKTYDGYVIAHHKNLPTSKLTLIKF